MKKKMLSFVLLAVLVGAGCSNPFAPSGGSSDDCPDSAGIGGTSCGTGVGPGPTVRASVIHKAFVGDCAGGPGYVDNCSGTGLAEVPLTEDPELLRQWSGTVDEVRAIRMGQTYTSMVCVTHPGVPGRKIDLYVSIASNRFQQLFDEGDPSWGSPICLSRKFVKLDQGGQTGIVQMFEGKGDLRESFETKLRFGFVVVLQ